ncbi:MAG TPA: helix-turn-helix transcriptional regulator [Solirubrobacteraceae bacterium]|nr:helix-turn-helix transcriptional regulator [Solirubrobacteraceae bacterium]
MSRSSCAQRCSASSDPGRLPPAWSPSLARTPHAMPHTEPAPASGYLPQCPGKSVNPPALTLHCRSMLSNLRQLREREGLSRAALAREARLNERTLKRIEDGEDGYSPTRVTMNKLRNALNRNPTRSRDYELADLFPSDGERE